LFAAANGTVTVNAVATATATTTPTGSLTLSGPRGNTFASRSTTKTFTATVTRSATVTVPFAVQATATRPFSLEARDSGFAMGDVFLQPLWLDWSGKHYDISLSDGVYAPTGRYSSSGLDNTGRGFWTNQTQLAAAYYPFPDQGTALTVAGTYEVHGTQRETDIRPGNDFSLNWGLSQYLPLNKEQTWLVEVGPTGYDTWQVTGDSGGGVNLIPSSHNQVHAWGIQTGLAQTKWNAALTVRWLHEYSAVDRTKGNMLAVNFAVKF
jgi:hypothetical protein